MKNWTHRERQRLVWHSAGQWLWKDFAGGRTWMSNISTWTRGRSLKTGMVLTKLCLIDCSHLLSSGLIVLCLFGGQKMSSKFILQFWQKIQVTHCNITCYLSSLKANLSSDSCNNLPCFDFLLLLECFCWMRLGNFGFYSREWCQVSGMVDDRCPSMFVPIVFPAEHKIFQLFCRFPLAFPSVCISVFTKIILKHCEAFIVW